MKVSELEPALQSVIVGIARRSLECGLSAEETSNLWTLGELTAMASLEDGADAATSAASDTRPKELGKKLLRLAH